MHQRITLLLVLAFIWFHAPAQSGWARNTPLPQENHINDITKIPGTGKIIAVCDQATIMISDDNGESWQILLNPAGIPNDRPLETVYFYNSTIGFIGGNCTVSGDPIDYVLKTTDGGDSWTVNYNIPGSDINQINDIYFVNPETGFALGYNGRLFKTVDGGENWFILKSGVTFSLYAIDFCNDSTGFIVGGSYEKILKTNNFGNTWSVVDFISPITTGSLRKVQFVSPTIGYVVMNYGDILKTNSAGNNWGIIFAHDDINARTIDFIDENNGVAAGYQSGLNSCVVSTIDGGINWSVFTLPEFQMENYSVCCMETDQSLFGGLNGTIYKSANSGNTWNPKFDRTFWGDIFQVQYLGDNTIFCLAVDCRNYLMPNSCLYKSTDGGESYTLIATIEVVDNGYQSPAAFCFPDEDVGYLTYYHHDNLLTILKTEDGGMTWTETESGNLDYKPYAMAFTDIQTGLISGDGFILKTTDGGLSWQEVFHDFYTYYMMDIQYVSDSYILVTSASYWSSWVSELLISHDGGSSWETFTLGNYGIIVDIEVINGNIFLAGSGSTILKSPDAGTTWQFTQVMTLNDIEFHAIHFPTEDIGYAVGTGPDETMVKTTNGGMTWYPISSGITSGMNTVHFENEQTGWVYGDNGVVLQTVTGGTTAMEEYWPEKETTNISVYPNPFTESFSVQYQLPESAKSGVIEIFSQNGKRIMSHPLKKPMGNFMLSGENLSTGIYLIFLKTGTDIKGNQKIIKLP
nr:T9SS type A sorting domain-containing protein [Bacteroidota bacterium]